MTTAHEQGVVAESSATTPRKFPIGEYVFASVVIVLAIVVLIGAGMIRVPAGSSNVLGARAFPYGVGILLLLAGIAVFIGILRGKLGDPEGGEDIAADVPTSWFTVIKISACFLSLIVLIPLAGWPIAVTVLFAGASLSRREEMVACDPDRPHHRTPHAVRFRAPPRPLAPRGAATRMDPVPQWIA
ncbi:tripartite tricarboxylate transporter TctB family protein [Humidisolicoccus flavus]|uniref:tripartite tricarboxylate transporter TctB family protein n=1 Tax=Humidisolicoccus flavus TaxID=3111414 RepID=UPI0032499FC2